MKSVKVLKQEKETFWHYVLKPQEEELPLVK
jgi:hypothetical protein